uniref:Pleckstrin homology domain containing A2 n=1 Tax=Fundulus heteroclitus TaxID=8078 RepID=A0A3Q2QK11_FUNHE
MPYLDRFNRVCGFLDIEEKENSSRFQRRYFILNTQENVLQWYMDNPQNLASGASYVGSLRLTYISKVSETTAKQKPKTEFCFVINAVSRRYFLQANDADDMRDWVKALNKATKITVRATRTPCIPTIILYVGEVWALMDMIRPPPPEKQQAYKTEIIGGVVVHTPIQNETEETEGREKKGNRPGVLRCGFCVKQGNVRKSWKRRFFTLDDNTVSYYKTDTDKEPLRGILLRDIQKVHECLVKSGDLLLRDNLFEIITNSRTFYIQTDTPEEMHGWIRDIDMKIREFRGPPRVTYGYPFKRGSSLHQKHNASSACCQQTSETRPQLIKSCSVAPGWQPWTPVPPGEPSIIDMEDEDSPFSPAPTVPSLSSSGRRRHRSQPQPHSAFPFSLDDDGIRTTDV